MWKNLQRIFFKNVYVLFFQFRFATWLDVVLTLLGLISAMLHGTALPLLIVVFGDMTDLFINNADQEAFFNTLVNGTNYTAEQVYSDENLARFVSVINVIKYALTYLF